MFSFILQALSPVYKSLKFKVKGLILNGFQGLFNFACHPHLDFKNQGINMDSQKFYD